MKCPECQSSHIRKNGMKRGKQNHICVDCLRQFVIRNKMPRGYSDAFKQDCLKLYVNGMGLRGIERVKGVHHTTVITWIKQVGGLLPDAYAPDALPDRRPTIAYPSSVLHLPSNFSISFSAPSCVNS